jgi:hypothetical protein
MGVCATQRVAAQTRAGKLTRPQLGRTTREVIRPGDNDGVTLAGELQQSFSLSRLAYATADGKVASDRVIVAHRDERYVDEVSEVPDRA